MSARPSSVRSVSLPVLFCCDPLNPRRVDPHFAIEAKAVRELGGQTVVIDHDALVAGDAHQAVTRVPGDLGPVWYRGWMIPTPRYAELAVALAQRGTTLITTADRYQAAHELPGWYEVFDDADLTPRSAWTPSPPNVVPAEDELAALAARLGAGPGIVKDFVKSRKHEWDTACFVPDLADTQSLRRIVAKFVELQGDFLAGGIVLRRFETLVGDGRPAEARVWWLDGQPILIGPHPDTADLTPDAKVDPLWLPVRRLSCRFITSDLAIDAHGNWRVIEVGDGQVSDLPATVEPTLLISALIQASPTLELDHPGAGLPRPIGPKTVVYTLDGTRINTLEDFWPTIGDAIGGPRAYFGRNLDAFADCLSGGYGTPDDGDFILEWRDHAHSRHHLGYPETARQLELRLQRCHPANRPMVTRDLEAARCGQGPTVFDWLVEIFDERAPGSLFLR